MKVLIHRIYIFILIAITASITAYLIYLGKSYYALPLSERFYSPLHETLKPSGFLGHGLGIIGTFLVAFGVVMYMVSKRYGIFDRFIRLKYLLEFHIFLCVLGPILILFHTTFKVGGLVSIAFWSMVMVVASGVVGRFIYVQIPRSDNGSALSLDEIHKRQTETLNNLTLYLGKTDISVNDMLGNSRNFIPGIKGFIENKKNIYRIKSELSRFNLTSSERKHILSFVKNEIYMIGRINRLQKMQNLFKYWHVAHLPFALIMLVIALVHISVSLFFGYTWMF